MLSVAGDLETSLISSNSPVANTWGHTKSDRHSTKYKWAIDNFSFRKENVGVPLKSPVFKVELPDRDIDLIIKVFPFGDSSASIGYVSAFVEVLSKDVFINARAKLGVVTRSGFEKELFNLENSKILSQHYFLGSSQFLARSDLFNANSDYCIASDRFAVYCEFSVVCESVNVRCANFKGSTIAKTVSEDIEELFESQKFSDFALIVGGRALKVHKLILAARSPFFAAKIMPEATTKVEITDLSYEAVVEFLRYIYTGQVKNIEKISLELLLASIRYQMEGLKPMCFEDIISKMNVDNGAKVLKFAHENKLQELKEAAVDYFKKHSKAIMKTNDFETLKRACPEFVLCDLFEALAV